MMSQNQMSARLPVPSCSDYLNYKWEPTENQVKLFEEWKGYCIGYLASCADGSNISRLLSALADHTAEEVPLQKMGFGSVYLFLYEMADFIEIRRKVLPARVELHVLVRETAVPEHFKHVRAMVLEQKRPKDEFRRKIRSIRELTEYVPPLQLLEEHFRRKSTWFYNAGSNNYAYGGPTVPPYHSPYPDLPLPPPRTPSDCTLSSYMMPGLSLLGPDPANPYPQFQFGPQQQRRQEGTVTATSTTSAPTLPEVDSRQAMLPLNDAHQPPKVSIKSNGTPITEPEPGELIKRKPVTIKYTRQELLNLQSARAPPQKSTSAANPGTSLAVSEATSERAVEITHPRNTRIKSGPIKLVPSAEDPRNGKPATLNFPEVDSALTPTKAQIPPQNFVSKMEYTASKSEVLLPVHSRNAPTARLSEAVTTDSEAMADATCGKEAQVTELRPPAIKFDMDFKINRRHLVDCFPYASCTTKGAQKVRLFKGMSENTFPPLASGRNVITLSLKTFMAGYMNHP